jgi:hypothetical protein
VEMRTPDLVGRQLSMTVALGGEELGPEHGFTV